MRDRTAVKSGSAAESSAGSCARSGWGTQRLPSHMWPVTFKPTVLCGLGSATMLAGWCMLTGTMKAAGQEFAQPGPQGLLLPSEQGTAVLVDRVKYSEHSCKEAGRTRSPTCSRRCVHGRPEPRHSGRHAGPARALDGAAALPNQHTANEVALARPAKSVCQLRSIAYATCKPQTRSQMRQVLWAALGTRSSRTQVIRWFSRSWPTRSSHTRQVENRPRKERSWSVSGSCGA